jgi:hypothetical protein
MSGNAPSINPLSYAGVLPNNPTNLIKNNRAPTVRDINANIGDEWENTSVFPSDFYKLANLFNNSATWILLSSSSAAGIEKINVQTGNTPIVPSGGVITFNGATVAAGTNPVRTDGTDANTMALEVQISQALAAGDATKIGLSNFNSAQFTVLANGFVSLIGGSTAPLLTLSDDNNPSPPTVPVTPINGNIQFVGHVVEQGATKFSTVVANPATAPTHVIDINPMTIARWIVDPLGFNGTHTTIASAMASAVSGDTILVMPGTYTEDITIKPGISLNGANVGGPNSVLLIGKISFSAAGTANIANMTLQTNGDFIIEVTGANNCQLAISFCTLLCSNNTGVNFTNSNVNSAIAFGDANIILGTTGIAFYTMSSPGFINVIHGVWGNGGASITASTNSAGTVTFVKTIIRAPLSTTGTGIILESYCNHNTNDENVTPLTVNGAGISFCEYTDLLAGTDPALSVGAGATINIFHSRADSSNVNALTGLGTMNYAFIVFTGSSSGHNVSVENAYATLI